MRHKPGDKYNQLTLLEKQKDHWLCQCDCGKIKLISRTNIRTTKSCGCLRVENCRKVGANYNNVVILHNQSRSRNGKPTKEYNAWSSLIKRCLNPNSQAYKNYGGRGIKVCEEWKNSFVRFYNDMGKAPEGYQIDRIDNDGDYEPSNCRWVTPKENINNRIRK